MATISELNIRLGLLTKEFERNLRKVERDLRNSGQRLSQLGSDLTLAISAPLAAIGGFSIKAAGDIEALRLAMQATFEGGGRSIAEANKELELLRQAALAPGLDFEQAVRGSVRLQNVGFQAETARAILVELANAIATTGGTAQELDGVTRQFAQMIGKSQIYQEDLTIILENMPKISDAMKEAFGTVRAEELNKLGITAEEFILGVTKEFAKLPRVAGGISNSIVNLLSGIKNAASRLGEEINRVFNVGEISQGLVDALNGLVDAFTSLSTPSKKIIVTMAALLAAAGPLAFVMGRLVSIFAVFKTGIIVASNAVQLLNARIALYGAIQKQVQASVLAFEATSSRAGAAMTALSGAFAANKKAIEANRVAGTKFANNLLAVGDVANGSISRFSGLSGAVQRAATAFTALGAAQKLLLAAGVVGIIATVTVAVIELTRELTTAEKIQRSIAKVTQTANEAIAEEKTKVSLLVGVLKDQNATREEQEKALEKLKAISPEYFGSLDLEKAKVQDIDAALDGYISQLLRAAKAQAAFDELVNIEKRLNNLKEEADPSVWQQIGNAVLSAGNTFTGMGLNASSAAKNMEELRASLEAQRKALTDVIADNTGVAAAINKVSEATETEEEKQKRLAAAREEAARKAKLYKDALASIAAVVQKGDVLGADVFSEQAKEIENQIERLLENGFKPYSREIENLRGMLAKLKADLQSGFSTPNATQAQLGIDPTTPTPIATLPPLTQVISVDTDAANVNLDEFKVKVEGVGNAFLSFGEQVGQVLEGLNNRTIEFSEGLSSLLNIAVQNSDLLGGALLGAADAFAQAAASGEASAAKLAAATLAGAAKAIRVIIQQGVAQTVLSALRSVPFPFNVAIAAGAGAAASALFNKAISSIGIPSLAEGGVASSPTLALIGDAGAGNPEIVAPEAKLRQIFRQEGGGSGELRAVVRGDDLLFIVDKAANRRGRLR